MEQDVQAEVRRLLGRATRHGLYNAAATRSGLLLARVAPGFRIATESIDQVVHDSTPTDVSTWVNSLYVERAERLNLDTTSLFKLRAILLLGLGPARYLSSVERRLALARTYRISARSGENAALGAKQFRNRASDVFRGERDAILDGVAELLAKSIVDVASPPAALLGKPVSVSLANDYRIADYEDQHLYPASGAHHRSVMRRRTIVALRDGVTQFRAQYTLTSIRGVAARPRIVGVGHLSVEYVRPHAENGETGQRYDLVIDFPPLKKGQRRVLQWVVERDQPVTSAGGIGIQVAGLTPSVDIEHATISMRFEPPVAPSRCWRFDNLEPGDARLEEMASEDLILDDGYISSSWDQPARGRAFGIAWRW